MLTLFRCNKEYVFYSDDGFWNVLAEISISNVSSSFVCLLWLLSTSFFICNLDQLSVKKSHINDNDTWYSNIATNQCTDHFYKYTQIYLWNCKWVYKYSHFILTENQDLQKNLKNLVRSWLFERTFQTHI